MIRSGGFYNFAWDPIEGCKHNCWYCYARTEIEKSGRKFDEVKFFENRLMEPFEVKPSTIFVNHLADIMGEWIPDLWIKKILDVCFLLPEHDFIWMTKNPQRYYDFQFPQNCILGVTVESKQQWGRTMLMKGLKNRTMCSCEPILGSFAGCDFSQFELVVVGGLLGIKSNQKYYHTVHHQNTYYKYK